MTYKQFEELLNNTDEDPYYLRDYCLRYIMKMLDDNLERKLLKIFTKFLDGDYIQTDIIRFLNRITGN